LGLINRFNRVTARLAGAKVSPRRSAGPILSLCFDDFPKSAWERGGAILEEHSAKATYYAAGRFCGKTIDGLAYYDRADLAELAAAGHEIGCHTFSHKHPNRISSAELKDDCARNRQFLAENLEQTDFPSFAYPYGEVSVRVKAVAARRYATARGIWSGVNTSPLDLALLKAMPLESRSWSTAAMERLAAEAARTRGWLILFTHDVSDEPSAYGCTPWMLTRALEIAARHGLETLPVGVAARRLLAANEPARPVLDRAA